MNYATNFRNENINAIKRDLINNLSISGAMTLLLQESNRNTTYNKFVQIIHPREIATEGYSKEE